MEINRLGSRVSITNETETVENRAGEMQSVIATISSSQAATRLRVTRDDGALQIETEAGGKTYEKKVPFTGTLVGPKGIEKLSRENLRKEGAKVSYRMFSPEFGNVATMERKVVRTIDDKGRKLLKCEETIEGFPGKQFVTIDENGRWITRQQTFPFGELVIEPSTARQDGAGSSAVGVHDIAEGKLRSHHGALEHLPARSARHLGADRADPPPQAGSRLA